MAEHRPHSGHFDAELNKPEELTNQRLTDIACQCLQRWDSYPTLPGSRRWSVNGRTALRELERRLGDLIEQFETTREMLREIAYPAQDGAVDEEGRIWTRADLQCVAIDRARNFLDSNPASRLSDG